MPYPTQSEKDKSAFVASVLLASSVLGLALVAAVVIALVF